jgi:hypothetical protein
MIRRTLMLSDLEDRALATRDDQHLAVPTVRAILSNWLVHHISTGEMRVVCARLVELGVLNTYVCRLGVLVAPALLGNRTRCLQVRAIARRGSLSQWTTAASASGSTRPNPAIRDDEIATAKRTFADCSKLSV